MGYRASRQIITRCALGVATTLAVWPPSVVDAQQVAATGSPAHQLGRIVVSVDNAPLAVVLHTIAREAGLIPAYDAATIPVQRRVTLHLRDVSVGDAFREALRGTGLVAQIPVEGQVIIVAGNDAVITTGSVTGKVEDAKTGRPVRGAAVSVDDATRSVQTGDNGVFRISGIAAGTHHITVRILGYVRQQQVVTVADNETSTVNVRLEPSTSVLSQVVVTGTVVQTELKAVPNAITVITAKQIEERGITKIDQLFRGDVPGLFAQNRGSNAPLDQVVMFSRGATALSSVSSGLSTIGDVGALLLTNPIKTYVDGVELADAQYLSQIDPKSIERIEIIAGPQASTIYGSNAINGVMQVFTKRGSTTHPQLTLNLLSGWVENNFSSARTPQHDDGVQLSGIEGRISYNAGGTWNYMGRWSPAKQLARTGGFGGARIELPTPFGRVTSDMTFRRSITQSQQRASLQQSGAGYRETGLWAVSAGNGLTTPTNYTVAGQTLGLMLNYVPADWWSHEFGLGQDVSDFESRYTEFAHRSPSDTTLNLRQDRTARRSLHYATTIRIPIAARSQVTITAGGDGWQSLASSWSARGLQSLTGNLNGSTEVSRQPSHNSGGFLQSQFGITDRLSFTYGLRAEWNPDFGQEAQPNYAPRYGVAYTQEAGPVTVKLRGAYGHSTRPPQTTLKLPQSYADYGAIHMYGTGYPADVAQYYGPFDYYLANPNLGPEYQRGGEGGLEVYLGTRGSLVVTRYNQTVDGLIAPLVGVDSVRSLVPNPIIGGDPCSIFIFFQSFDVCSSQDSDGYGYIRQGQYVNIASLRNEGWELQGNVNVGPVTTRGTYSWTKSRTIGVNPKYRANFADQPQYQPGATFQYLPEHTWALGITYARNASSVGLNFTGTGRITTEYANEFYLENLSGLMRLPQNRQNMFASFGFSYVSFNNAYALADLNASHRFASHVEGILQVQNLMDRYINDFAATYASLGRQAKAGVRIRTQ